MNAIKKFNGYCARLEELYDPAYKTPLPLPLPTKLANLREDSNLMEDVWITPASDDPPRWLEDADVRSGIRAMLKVDRCLEERRRLGCEADNLCRWFGRELSAIELALRTPSSKANSIFLEFYLTFHSRLFYCGSAPPSTRSTALSEDSLGEPNGIRRPF